MAPSSSSTPVRPFPGSTRRTLIGIDAIPPATAPRNSSRSRRRNTLPLILAGTASIVDPLLFSGSQRSVDESTVQISSLSSIPAFPRRRHWRQISRGNWEWVPGDEPILARQAGELPTAEIARRQKSTVISTAAIFGVLMAGVIVTTNEAVQARRAEQTAQAVNDFLQTDLPAQASASRQASPSTKRERDLKALTALDRSGKIRR